MIDSLQSIEFQSDHLLSKWGFDDGDLLMPLLKDNGFPKIDEDNEFWIHFNNLVLCEVVEYFVCPEIKNEIRPYRCLTSHNPIRIYEINGTHISELPQAYLLLFPYSITVPSEQIISTAQRLYEQRDKFKGENGDWNYLIPSDFVMRIRQDHGWD